MNIHDSQDSIGKGEVISLTPCYFSTHFTDTYYDYYKDLILKIGGQLILYKKESCS